MEDVDTTDGAGAPDGQYTYATAKLTGPARARQRFLQRIRKSRSVAPAEELAGVDGPYGDEPQDTGAGIGAYAAVSEDSAQQIGLQQQSRQYAAAAVVGSPDAAAHEAGSPYIRPQTAGSYQAAPEGAAQDTNMHRAIPHADTPHADTPHAHPPRAEIPRAEPQHAAPPREHAFFGADLRHVPQPAAAEAAPDAGDPLLNALQYLARTWGRPVSVDVLLAGLPLSNGKVSMSTMPRALERVGLVATEKRMRLLDLADFDMPALFYDDFGTLVIALQRLPAGDLIGFDVQTGADVVISPQRARAKTKRHILLVKPAFSDTGIAGEDAEIRRRHWLRSALSGHGRSIANVALAAAFVNVFAIAMPIFTMNVYDRVLPNKATATLWVLAIGLVLVQIFDLLLKLGRGAVIDYVGRKIDFRISSALFDRVINTSMAARPGSTGAFINRITQYEVLRDFLTSNTVVMFVDLLFMGLFVYVIAMLIGWITVLPVICAALAIAITLAIGARSGAAIKSSLQESASRNAILVETLSAAQTVKATRAESQFLHRWENSVLASSETNNKIKTYQSAATQMTALLGQFASVAIIIGGTYSFADAKITTGAIIAAMMLSNRLIGPVAMISAALLRTRAAIEAYRVLDGIMKLPDERTVRKGLVTRAIKSGRIDFDKVRFAYPGSTQFVLDQVSFSIQPGEKVGIIGRVGSGKTTIGKLLVHFYEPAEGDILVDGVSLNQYHPAELRRQVGLLLQEPELFNGTVKENIVVAKPDATDEEIVDAARRAGVEQFVARHPLGYDMPVGERGLLLSGGQRQAVALARTLLVGPRIMFLDEPSSSLDMAAERQLIEHLNQSLAPDTTVLIATHRYSLLSLVTRLIVVDNGHIVADGPRDEVLNRLRAMSSPVAAAPAAAAAPAVGPGGQL